MRGEAANVDFHGASNTREIYGNRNTKIFQWVNTMIGNVKKAIHGTYHAVRPKHVPRYLAECCFRLNNRFYMGAMVGALIRYSAVTKPIPQRIIKIAEVERESVHFFIISHYIGNNINILIFTSPFNSLPDWILCSDAKTIHT